MALLTLSQRVNALVAEFVRIETRQHDPATPDAEAEALGTQALAVMDEIEGIEDSSGNVDLAAALILMEIMLNHCYPEFPAVQWGQDDRQRLRLLTILSGSTTGEIRRHTTAVLATIGVTVSDEPDPLLTFLTDWRQAIADFEALPLSTDEEDNAYRAAHVEPLESRIIDGTMPAATTAAGAAKALREALAFEGMEDIETGFVKAALAFLEGRA